LKHPLEVNPFRNDLLEILVTKVVEAANLDAALNRFVAVLGAILLDIN